MDVYDTVGFYLDYPFLNGKAHCGRCPVGVEDNHYCGVCMGSCKMCDETSQCISGHLWEDATDPGGEIVHYDFSNTGVTWIRAQAPTAGLGGSFIIDDDDMAATPY
jgi:hypothetical protein